MGFLSDAWNDVTSGISSVEHTLEGGAKSLGSAFSVIEHKGEQGLGVLAHAAGGIYNDAKGAVSTVYGDIKSAAPAIERDIGSVLQGAEHLAEKGVDTAGGILGNPLILLGGAALVFLVLSSQKRK